MKDFFQPNFLHRLLLMLTKKQKKQNLREEFFFQILFFGLTLALIGLLMISNFRINRKRKELTEQIEVLKKEIQILEEKKAELEAGISQTEKKSYWEEIARQQGYIREGENPVVILPPKEKIEKGEGKEIWNPRVWWEWLKSKLGP